jgi:4-nitrophenyl phosphatase
MDAQFPGRFSLLPGGGAIVSPISISTGIQPIVMGKPEPMILDILMKK